MYRSIDVSKIDRICDLSRSVEASLVPGYSCLLEHVRAYLNTLKSSTNLFFFRLKRINFTYSKSSLLATAPCFGNDLDRVSS